MYQKTSEHAGRTASPAAGAARSSGRDAGKGKGGGGMSAGARAAGLQMKLTVNQPGDRYEQEADRVAEKVMRMSAAQIQRKCAACEKEEKGKPGTLMRAETSEPASAPEVPSQVYDVLGRSGSPLDSGIRSFMEPRFGYDFSNVRVHTDAQAAESAQAVNARAYTVGNSVVFGAGQYSPSSTSGRELLAHELAHVVQQGGGGMLARYAAPSGGLDEGGVSEHDAHAGESLQRAVGESASGGMLQRQQKPSGGPRLLFGNTFEICHWLLDTRKFTVSQGGLKVAIRANWLGPNEGGASCESHRKSPYHVTLNQVDYVFDNEYGTCDFDPEGTTVRTWTGLPAGKYYLTIWTNNTNPYCCLNGDVEVSEEANLTGSSCGKVKDYKMSTVEDKGICGPEIKNWLINKMNTNASSAIVKSMRKRNDEDIGVDWGALWDWYQLVKTGGPWDFKRNDILGSAISSMAPCRQNCRGKLYSVTLDGQCMTYEVAANIHYGYVGRHAGFSEERLLSGASTAQVSENRGEAADDPRDVEAIKKGFALFNAGSPAGLNKSGLESNHYDRLPPGDGDPKGCEKCTTELT